MKKLISCLIVMTLLPVAFMVGCNDKAPSSPRGSGSPTATPIITGTPATLTVTRTPTNTATPTATATGTITPSVGTATAQPTQAAVVLGTAGTYAVLAGSAITDAGEVICGDYGISPGSTETGSPYAFSPSCSSSVANIANAAAANAQSDLNLAYNDALGRLNPTPVPTVAVGDIGGEILYPGLYSASSIGITGPVTLDGQNASNPVFIFQISSTLITGTSSSVTLINGATAPNVIWQVGSSATLGTSSSLAGIILAKSAITFNTGATLEGRALAETAAVVFDGLNFITNP